MAGTRTGRGGLPGFVNRRRTWRNAHKWVNIDEKSVETRQYDVFACQKAERAPDGAG